MREENLKILDCEWDDWNIDHIHDHDVEPYEVKEVFVNRPLIRKGRKGKYLAYGQSRAYPITARDSNWKEKQYAQTQKR